MLLNQVVERQYQEERNSLKKWMETMDKNDKLKTYKKNHFRPRDMKNI